jgi:hypothetical protein
MRIVCDDCERTHEVIVRSKGVQPPDGTTEPVAWPQRFGGYIPEIGGYVVWRDVFEGDMKCALRDAILTHKTAVFVTESEARDYCDYRNRRTAATGTDSVSIIEGVAKP